MQALLARPQVELDAHAGQAGADPLDHQSDTLGHPILKRGVIGKVELRGDGLHLITRIAALGDVVAETARLHRLTEQSHLITGVVDVVLAGDLLAGELEQARDAVAVGGIAC